MSEKTQSSNRKVLLINPPFQFRFMGWMGGVSVAVVLVMHLAHVWFFHNLKEQARLAGLPPDHVFYRFIQDRQSEMDFITLVTFLVVVVIVGLAGLFLSHKIAGPMYRLRKHFETLAKTGVSRPLKFRDGDYFLEIPEAHNLQFKKTELKKAI